MDEERIGMERMAEMNIPTWVEDPTPAFNVIKMCLERGVASTCDESEKTEVERIAAEKAVLAKFAPGAKELV